MAVPFQVTASPDTKFEPFTVIVKAGEPAMALAGDKVEMAGAGTLIVNVAELEALPPAR